MKSLSDLWRISANELAEWCHTSATLDIKTAERRVKAEGLSFFTITLPQFGKDFERGLDLGRIDDAMFLGFKRHGGLPVFMQGFLRQCFDACTGVLLQEPNIDCIFAVRFLTKLYSKIELPCSNSRVARAMERYVECDDDIRKWESTASPDLLAEFSEASRFLLADAFTRMDFSIYSGELQPRHGPGATADRLVGNDKFNLSTWHTRLEEVFPYGEYVLPSWRYYRQLDHVDFIEPGRERPVKVIPVPKTLRSPRIIAVEPTCMQFMQQALRQVMVQELEHPRQIISNFVGFEDQDPNRDLARKGSQDGTLATLDLKEASDRVPALLVKVMTQDWPHLQQGLFASRTTRATIPSIGVSIPNLRKFASMGSATCFPIEAIVFMTIVFIGIKRQMGLPRTRSLRLVDYVGKVRVYGDDIIVPVDSVPFVIRALEDFGFLVNSDKSFWNGKFRESCGGDYYDGQDVTPVRLSQAFPSSRNDHSRVASLVAFRNHLYLRGLWNTTSWLDKEITKLLGGFFPLVEPTSPCLGRRSFLPYQAEKIDARTHAPRVRAYVQVPRLQGISLDGVGALFKCLSSNTMYEDDRHLERSGRPLVVDTKLRWVTPY